MIAVLRTKTQPLLVRVTHWVHAITFLMMIWSGLMIYWANDVYWPPIPAPVCDALGLDHQLARGMAIHFLFMWIFTLNGILYVAGLLRSGNWHKFLSGNSPYNPTQRRAYAVVIALGAGLLFTGFAIYKPVQLFTLTQIFGGYEVARAIHFYLMAALILFTLGHVFMVVKAGLPTFFDMVSGPAKTAGRNFAVFGAGAFAAALVIIWMGTRPDDNGIPGPYRRALQFNEKISGAFVDPSKRDRSQDGRDPAQVKGKSPRQNGDLGLETPIDLSTWSMEVISPLGSHSGAGESAAPATLKLTMDDLRKLPRTEILTTFKCIEGWSEVTSYAGVKFTDFLKAYHLGTHSGEPADFENHKDDLYSHVGLETPDGNYYVSIDMKSMLMEQTLLAYEMNGFALSSDHGAPLRLIIPNKYGVKSLKRVGRILFADHPLPDYWGEQGYDWFIGL